MPKDVSNEYLARPEVTPAPATIVDWRKLAKQAKTQTERVTVLRNFLASLPEERFNMVAWSTGFDEWSADKRINECGTVACIAGWATHLARPAYKDLLKTRFSQRAKTWLKLTADQADAMFVPSGFVNGYTTSAQAVAMLDNFLANGEVKWRHVDA
jgi:hypothetical protein